MWPFEMEERGTPGRTSVLSSFLLPSVTFIFSRGRSELGLNQPRLMTPTQRQPRLGLVVGCGGGARRAIKKKTGYGELLVRASAVLKS